MELDFLNITDESEKGFQFIAEKLFNEWAIQTHESVYRITEIEFYWNSKSHIDKSTYQRIHVNPKSGEWFFHYSGVDIALKNETNGGYGGILLRAVYDLKNKKPYKGPMVCAMRLFSGTNAFIETIKTKIIPYTFSESEIKNSERIGLGKNAIENDAQKFQYRFLITNIML
jgi:hypothetical protein